MSEIKTAQKFLSDYRNEVKIYHGELADFVIVRIMEAYHLQFKPSDDEIDSEFEVGVMSTAPSRRDVESMRIGAKAIRDIIFK